jgi:hypothetical protein
MNYEKLSIERFADNLKAGKYASRTGARRAIGKVDWTNKDKDKGRELVERYFGPEDKNGAAAAVKPKVSVKKAEKAEKAEAAVKPRKVGAPKGPRVKRLVPPVQAAPALHAESAIGGQPEPDKVHRMFIAERVIGASSSAIEAMAKAKAIDSKIDITEMQGAINAMNSSVQVMLALLEINSTETNGTATVEVEDEPVQEEEDREAELFTRARPQAGGSLGAFAS